MQGIKKIEKRIKLNFADIFDFLTSDARDQENFDLLNYRGDLFARSPIWPLTADMVFYIDDSIKYEHVQGGDGLQAVYPDFSLKNSLECIYKGSAVIRVFRILRDHVETPSLRQFLDSLNYYAKNEGFLAINMPFEGFVFDFDGRKIDLTGPGSHTLAGNYGGCLRLAPKSFGKKSDLHVEVNQRINWAVFSPFASEFGGFWPNEVNYSGADSGFFDWSRTRCIDRMCWKPILAEDRVVDASAARLNELVLDMGQEGGHLHLILPSALKRCSWNVLSRLSLKGDFSRLSFAGDIARDLSLSLLPATSRDKNSTPWYLPDLGILQQVETLCIDNGPLAQPVSLKGIERFSCLRHLDIEGSFCDFDGLLQLRHLETLGLRYMADVSRFPDLGDFPQLKQFIAWNVEDAGGKRLRKQFNACAAHRPWTEYSCVSKLRKPEWWEKEYGHPFSNWQGKLKKTGYAAYQNAQDVLQKARNREQAKAAFIAFAATFNPCKNIETGEREDIGEAVWKLSQLPHMAEIGITEETAQQWFDEVRDY